MTIAEALRDAARRLEAVSDTARLDAELLMAHALRVSRSDMLLRYTRDEAPSWFEVLVGRRMAHEPIAYITGTQEFYGREFLVTPEVLIPRADSETIVEAALEVCPSPRKILDCGVGSGALLLTILAECPAARGVGIDRSDGALAIAKSNAERLECAQRADFVPCDWRTPGWDEGLGRFDLILTNPPYVESAAELARSVHDWEPGEALFAGLEGLDDYRILIPQLSGLLEDGGVAVVEIGSSQAEAVTGIAQKAGFAVQLRRDLAARPRALILRLTVGI